MITSQSTKTSTQFSVKDKTDFEQKSNPSRQLLVQ